jgi:hypothetical protein
MLIYTKETSLVKLTCQNVGGDYIRTLGRAQWIHTRSTEMFILTKDYVLS